MRDLTYPIIIPAAKAWFRVMDFRFRMAGTDNIPREGGALIALNHISYVDFILGGFAAQPAKRLVRFMAKREIFDSRKTGWLMRSMHHINVDRADGRSAADEAVRYLHDGELVGIFPEATISRSFLIKDLKTGTVRMAAAAGVPVVPVVLWGTQRLLTKDHPRDLSRHKTIAISVGTPMWPSGDGAVADTLELHRMMSSMLDETIQAYPAQEQPPGSWWLPARYGGSAPTPEEAAQLDRAEQRERAERRRAQRKAQAGSGT
jgi:1-acyl-sn-glycerol-3-phosphate acyltransferase